MQKNRSMIDVSRWNAQIDYKAVAASGVNAVFLKATQGTNWNDPLSFRHLKGFCEAGVQNIGFYHFGTNADPIAQVNFYYNTVRTLIAKLDRDDFRIAFALDFEGNPSGAQMLFHHAFDFLFELEKRTRIVPIIYGGGYLRTVMKIRQTDKHRTEEEKLNNEWFCIHPLWINDVGRVETPRLPMGFSKATFWQYSDRLPCPGVTGPIDSNHYFGSNLDGEFT